MGEFFEEIIDHIEANVLGRSLYQAPSTTQTDLEVGNGRKIINRDKNGIPKIIVEATNKNGEDLYAPFNT